MAKAILVIDMPKACYECPCVDQNSRCQATGKYNDELVEKQTWWPLKEVPQKKQGGDYTSLIRIGEVKGYNACIDEILGGGE